jgi:Leucine Rich repeat
VGQISIVLPLDFSLLPGDAGGMETPNRRPWWSYVRLSLRGLIVLVLVVGGGLGVIAHYMRSASIQREAVAAVQKLNGSALYDFQYEGPKLRLIQGSNIISQEVPGWPKWLVDRLGPDYFGNVKQVSFRNMNRVSGTAGPSSKEIDEALRHVGRLNQLTNLSLLRMPVTDTGLARLEGLTNLQSLMLRGRNLVTDAGVIHLKKMTSLKELNLEDAKVADAGLLHLEGLISLEGVNLAHTQVGDAGLAHLMGLPHLEWLGLDGTKVTDAGLVPLLRTRTRWTSLYLSDTKITDTLLESLADMISIRWLSLRNTQITDKGLAHLKGLTELRALDLYGTNASDAGLAHLKGLTKLQSLNAGLTRITDPGLQELQRTLPNLKTFR